MELFAILTIAPQTGSTKHLSPRRHTSLPGIDHHASAIKQWEASLPGVKLHGFVADLWKHFRQIGIGLNLIVVFWCHNSVSRRLGRLRGCPFGAAACVQGCARLPMAICALLQHHLLVPVQHYQDDHHCVEPSYSVAQAWTLIKHFYGLLGPKLATPWWRQVSVTQSSLPFACHQGLTSSFHRVKFKSFPRESTQSVVSSDRSFRPRNLSKGHASEIFGKLRFLCEIVVKKGRLKLCFGLRQRLVHKPPITAAIQRLLNP